MGWWDQFWPSPFGGTAAPQFGAAYAPDTFGDLRSPLGGPFAVTSGFGPRPAPMMGASTNHMGVDMVGGSPSGGGLGAPVYPSAPGTIVAMGENPTSGKFVRVQHGDGTVTSYAHLSGFGPFKQGDTVTDPANEIGYVGQTGIATGPHLHFGVQRGGQFVNPMPALGARNVMPAASSDMRINPITGNWGPGRLLVPPVPAPAPAVAPPPISSTVGDVVPTYNYGALGINRLQPPASLSPSAATPSAPAPEKPRFDWGATGPLWPILGAFGRGISQPTYYGFGGALSQGLNEASRTAEQAPFRRAQLEDLQARADERKAKADQRKAYLGFISSLPEGHPLKKWGPFLSPDQLAGKVFDKPAPGFVFDPDSGKYKVDPEWLQGQIQMRLANRAGINSLEQRAYEEWLQQNPGGSIMDFRSAYRAAGRAPERATALQRNTQYLSKLWGRSESEVASILSQSKGKSDRDLYNMGYGLALRNPALATSPQEADKFARQFVQDARRFASESGTVMPGPATPSTPSAPKTWMHSATGPNGQKVFSNDGQNWFYEDGRPYK